MLYIGYRFHTVLLSIFNLVHYMLSIQFIIQPITLIYDCDESKRQTPSYHLFSYRQTHECSVWRFLRWLVASVLGKFLIYILSFDQSQTKKKPHTHLQLKVIQLQSLSLIKNNANHDQQKPVAMPNTILQRIM